MSSEVDNEAARIVGMPFRSDMLAVVKAVLLARDAAIAECGVAVAECKAWRAGWWDSTVDSIYYGSNTLVTLDSAKAATDAAGLLEKYK